MVLGFVENFKFSMKIYTRIEHLLSIWGICYYSIQHRYCKLIREYMQNGAVMVNAQIIMKTSMK